MLKQESRARWRFNLIPSRSEFRRGKTSRQDLQDGALWRSDIDALVFPIRGHAALCAVHRRAFRTLLGLEPQPGDCLAYFDDFEDAFRAAAELKIAHKRIPAGTNLHLTSRDIARKLVELDRSSTGGLQ